MRVEAADKVQWESDWANGFSEFTAVKSGRYIFFATRYTGIMRYDTKTKKVKEIDKLTKTENAISYEPLEVFNGYLYYGKVFTSNNTTKTNLYRIKVNSTEKQKVIGDIGEYKIDGQRINYSISYYNEEDEEYVSSYYSVDLNGEDKRDESEFKGYPYSGMGGGILKNKYMKLSGRGYKLSEKIWKDSALYANKNLSFKITNKKNNKKRTIIAYGGYLTYKVVDDYVMYVAADATHKKLKVSVYVEKYNGKGKKKIIVIQCKNPSCYWS